MDTNSLYSDLIYRGKCFNCHISQKAFLISPFKKTGFFFFEGTPLPRSFPFQEGGPMRGRIPGKPIKLWSLKPQPFTPRWFGGLLSRLSPGCVFSWYWFPKPGTISPSFRRHERVIYSGMTGLPNGGCHGVPHRNSTPSEITTYTR